MNFIDYLCTRSILGDIRGGYEFLQHKPQVLLFKYILISFVDTATS